MDIKEQEMTSSELLDLIREWVKAEIDAKIADNEEDSGGYRGSGIAENKIADSFFKELKQKLIGGNMKINLKWPMKEDNDLAPWYITTWRLPFVPFIYLGFCISFIAILSAYGKDMAIDWWVAKDCF